MYIIIPIDIQPPLCPSTWIPVMTNMSWGQGKPCMYATDSTGAEGPREVPGNSALECNFYRPDNGHFPNLVNECSLSMDILPSKQSVDFDSHHCEQHDYHSPVIQKKHVRWDLKEFSKTVSVVARSLTCCFRNTPSILAHRSKQNSIAHEVDDRCKREK